MLAALRHIRSWAPRQVFRAANAAVVPVVKAGLGAPPPVGAGLIVLETTGRVSGRPRQVPLLATRCGDRVRVSTVRTGSQWARNVEADPDVSVWLNGCKRPARAEVAPGPLTVTTLDVD